MDAFVATTASLTRQDSSDRVGGHRQELYYDTFSPFLLAAYNQLVGNNRSFVKEWCPKNLSVSEFSLQENEVPLSNVKE